MRWAKSYSIVDHQLLHGGYLHRLSHEAMCLYLFLVVVGDRHGRSFYADTTIMEILRLDSTQLNKAKAELQTEGLIYYQRPYWFLRNIGGVKSQRAGDKGKDEALPHEIRDLIRICLKDMG